MPALPVRYVAVASSKRDCMGWFTLEHGKAAYRADFAAYGAIVVGLSGVLLAGVPRSQTIEVLLLVLTGLVEYALHRFVLHGLPPFRDWHAQHHRRPTALISTPTLMSAALIAVLVFVPAWLLSDVWAASALTLGLSVGYLAYAITHHATHHWHADNAWLKQRKRWHALHHGSPDQPCCFGVTSAFWDRVFGSARRAAN
jgi:cyclopropane-fatty-acyl-phospholipid synthase